MKPEIHRSVKQELRQCANCGKTKFCRPSGLCRTCLDEITGGEKVE